LARSGARHNGDGSDDEGRRRYRSVFRPGLFDGQASGSPAAAAASAAAWRTSWPRWARELVISGRSADKLERVAAEIAADGGRCTGAPSTSATKRR
jgi:hypothetical protein